jgi:hypothetical protein
MKDRNFHESSRNVLTGDFPRAKNTRSWAASENHGKPYDLEN